MQNLNDLEKRHRVIIRDMLGDDEIRYHVMLSSREYDNFVKTMRHQPGLSLQEALHQALDTTGIEPKELKE
jgi:hypothetical protein